MAKGDKFYFDNFMECASLSKKAAEYLVFCLENYDPDKLEEMLEKMHDFEHSADKKKHEMGEALAKAFVTPVDREDLDLMSHQLDNVLDILEEVLQKLYIYDIKTIHTSAIDYAKNLVRSCDLLYSIMSEFGNFKKSNKIHSLIIACNDVVALSTYKVLYRRGISVPDQVQLIGFDDIMWSSLFTPELTTIAQPIGEIAKRAAELIIDIEGFEGKGVEIVYPVELIARGTTKKKGSCE